MTDHTPLTVTLPEGVRCAIALSYDTDMAAGYAPDGVCHGRTAPFLAEYMLRLCETAESFGVALHFFQICNGLEPDQDVHYLSDIIARGHLVDCHTYSHLPLITPDVELLAQELERSNRLLADRLGVTSTVLRGPGGYAEGLRGLPENQRVILEQGYRWVSCQYSDNLRSRDWEAAVRNAAVDVPFAYDTGLIELPLQTWSDRWFFEGVQCVDRAAWETFRAQWGHRRVPDGFHPAWTAPDALEKWIEYNLAVAEYAYDNRLLCIMTWHPYSHYLHDPENRMLPALLQWAASQPERVWVCTVRDACGMVG